MGLSPLTAHSATPSEPPLKTDSFVIEVKHEISEQRIADVLVGAWEGGSNYWARSVGIPYKDAPDGGLVLSLPVQVYALDDPEKTYIIDRVTLEMGLRAMARQAPRLLHDILTEDEDANTSDALLQFACFGKIVYG